MDSLVELYLCLSSLFICATVSTGVSQYMAVAPIDDDDGDGDDELDRFEDDVLMVFSACSVVLSSRGGPVTVYALSLKMGYLGMDWADTLVL